MGGSKSKPQQTTSYSDNSSQINKSLSQIKTQINELNSDLDKFKVSIDNHVDTVQQKFIHFDNKVLQIQNEFQESFNFFNQGILMIGNNIDSMSKFQIEYETSNNNEHLEIQQNDWKENFERNVYQQFQRLKNLKFELELDLHKKVGYYLIIKNNFNDQIKIYQEKKSQFQITNLQSQILFLLNHFVEKSDSVDIVKFNQIENLVEKNELNMLEKTIQFPPELDESIIKLYLTTDKFEEIIKIETKLKEDIDLMMIHFSNPNLLNSLDNLITSPELLATKLYNSGIKSIAQIEFSNQTQILISNGFAYIPEYKYKELKKKFIIGCEKSNLKLNWELENINWISVYLYGKIQTKSIGSMIEYIKSDNCIYPIVYLPHEVNSVKLKLFNGLENKLEFKLEFKYETDPFFLYSILILNNKINNIELITNTLIIGLGYSQISDFALFFLKYQLEQIDKNIMIGGKQVLENNSINYDFELKWNSNLIQFNNLVSYVESNFIQKKNVDFNFIFDKGLLSPKLTLREIKIFFKKFICWLLSGIIKFQMKNFPNTFDIKLFLTIIINIICKTDYNTYNLHEFEFVKYSVPEFDLYLKLNKLEDVKIFISFIFFKIYDFYWNPNIK